MKACISQVTTLMNPFESDASSYRSGGWSAVELWLTKLESYVQAHSAAEARSLFDSAGVRPVAAAGQGGLLLSRGAGARRTGTSSGSGWTCCASWPSRP